MPITEADLHAWVDGQLDAGRRAEVEAWLAARPEERARAEAWARDSQALRAHLAPVMEEPVPVRIPTHRPGSGGAWRSWAAAAAMGVLGLGLGWFVRGQLERPVPVSVAARAQAFAVRAAVAHGVYSPEVRHPVEVGADQHDHLVAWLSKRMGAPMKAPNLGTIGFELVGGRLLPGERGPSAQFMYQDGAGVRLTLYVAKENAGGRDTAFRFEQAGGVNVFYWIDGPFGYALSSGIDKPRLQQVALEVYRQLDKGPDMGSDPK